MKMNWCYYPHIFEWAEWLLYAAFPPKFPLSNHMSPVFFSYVLNLQDENNEVDQTFSGYRSCEKKTNIAFLKTHKCASSSVQNILMRFGLKNQLNFALPSAGNYVGRWEEVDNTRNTEHCTLHITHQTGHYT